MSLVNKFNKHYKLTKKNNKLFVGFIKDDRYTDGTLVKEVALYNEYGTINIPSRPFMRNAIANDSKFWSKIYSNSLKKMGHQKSLNLLGIAVVSSIKESIINQGFDPLQDNTIKKKGFSTQLIDTRILINSITWRVQ